MEYFVGIVGARLELHEDYYYFVVAISPQLAGFVGVETAIAAEVVVAAATFVVEQVGVVAFAVEQVGVAAFEVGMAGPEKTAVVAHLRKNFASHYFAHRAVAVGRDYIQRTSAKLWESHQQKQN